MKRPTNKILKECAHCGMERVFEVFLDYNNQPLTCTDIFECNDLKVTIAERNELMKRLESDEVMSRELEGSLLFQVITLEKKLGLWN